MLYCGLRFNSWVENALNYLPNNVLNEINGKIAFTVLDSDACRVARQICEKNELIVLSHWIFPKDCISESDKEARYFVFCVLHEVAHVVLKHKSPLFDGLLVQENEQQESESNELAIIWFNTHIAKLDHLDLPPISIEEIREQQERNQKRLSEL